MVAAAPQQAEPQERQKVLQGQAAARRALNDGCADLD